MQPRLLYKDADFIVKKSIAEAIQIALTEYILKLSSIKYE